MTDVAESGSEPRVAATEGALLSSRTAEAGWLLADVGGTHARLAWQAGFGRPFEQLQVLSCMDHPRLLDALVHYLDRLDRRPVAAALAVAAPLAGDQVRFTNRDWSFSTVAVQQALGLRHLSVLNDFEALALALPQLGADDWVSVGGGQALPGEPRAVIGPGTGLGVSGLLSSGPGAEVALRGEGGHVTLAAQTELEWQVLSALRAHHGHVSAERILCGSGLVDLCRTLSVLQGQPVHGLTTPADVSRAALEHGEPLALLALEMFSAWLGGVAGDLALTLGARGGVFVAGGIVPRWLPWFQHSGFRARFEAKGRFRSYLEAIPTCVLTTRSAPAMLGASHWLAQQLTRVPAQG